jgi:hypothetical protein
MRLPRIGPAKDFTLASTQNEARFQKPLSQTTTFTVKLVFWRADSPLSSFPALTGMCSYVHGSFECLMYVSRLETWTQAKELVFGVVCRLLLYPRPLSISPSIIDR